MIKKSWFMLELYTPTPPEFTEDYDSIIKDENVKMTLPIHDERVILEEEQYTCKNDCISEIYAPSPADYIEEYEFAVVEDDVEEKVDTSALSYTYKKEDIHETVVVNSETYIYRNQVEVIYIEQ